MRSEAFGEVNIVDKKNGLFLYKIIQDKELNQCRGNWQYSHSLRLQKTVSCQSLQTIYTTLYYLQSLLIHLVGTTQDILPKITLT